MNGIKQSVLWRNQEQVANLRGQCIQKIEEDIFRYIRIYMKMYVCIYMYIHIYACNDNKKSS